MTIKERLNTFIKSLGISKRAFEREIGLSHGYISNIVNSIQPDKLERITSHYPELSPGWLMTGEGTMLKSSSDNHNDQQAILIPLLPVSAEGGTLSGFGDSVMLKDCEKIISPIKEADMAITISGESMAPEYPSGSQVVIKKINEKAFIDWGKAYIVDTCNGSIIKKLMPPDDGGKDRIKCVSINPEYPPFEVGFENIYAIYRILLCMSRK
ncbi:MAG: XRE family transcriptional regulator [Solitalea-like symbiont of Tyrophagus putrescentiae]